MYPPDAVFTVEQAAVITRIRQLIGDSKEVYIDDIRNAGDGCNNVSSNGNIYEMEEAPGYPLEVYVDGTEFIAISGAEGLEVIGYKYLRFTGTAPVITSSSSLLVIYHGFRNSDFDILETYLDGATTYLVAQCNLDEVDLTQDLLVLATAYILLGKDLAQYASEAVRLADSDSSYDNTARGRILQSLMDNVYKTLKDGIEAKTRCKLHSLPVYKVE